MMPPQERRSPTRPPARGWSSGCRRVDRAARSRRTGPAAAASAHRPEPPPSATARAQIDPAALAADDSAYGSTTSATSWMFWCAERYMDAAGKVSAGGRGSGRRPSSESAPYSPDACRTRTSTDADLNRRRILAPVTPPLDGEHDHRRCHNTNPAPRGPIRARDAATADGQRHRFGWRRSRFQGQPGQHDPAR